MNWKLLYDFSIKKGKPKWGKNDKINEWIPDCFKDLYLEYDPLKVELPYQRNSLNLIPYNMLTSTLEEYELDKTSIVFATCNGDPYIVKEQKVYTFVHDMEEPEWEFLNDNIDDFFMEIVAE